MKSKLAIVISVDNVPVSMSNLIQHINRIYKPGHYRLRKTRGTRSNLGDYYIMDYWNNAIVQTHVDVEKLGRELEVLAEWEYLEEDQPESLEG